MRRRAVAAAPAARRSQGSVTNDVVVRPARERDRSIATDCLMPRQEFGIGSSSQQPLAAQAPLRESPCVSTEAAREVPAPDRSSRRRRLIEFLDPAERLGEILFGLVMVLTFTLGTGLTVKNGAEGVRELLIAALGCNLAWGLIDGVMVVMHRVSERVRRQRLAHAIRTAASPETGLAIVRSELEPILGPLVGSELRERLYAEVRGRAAALPLERTRVDRADLLAGIASFCLVFFSTIPAALPFLLFADPHLALRVSNLLLLVLLFVVGWRWAAYTSGSRIAWGLAMLMIGTLLVVVAIALGG